MPFIFMVFVAAIAGFAFVVYQVSQVVDCALPEPTTVNYTKLDGTAVHKPEFVNMIAECKAEGRNAPGWIDSGLKGMMVAIKEAEIVAACMARYGYVVR